MEFPKPERNILPYSLTNDRFGYAVYSMVIFASPEQQSKIQSLRDSVKVRRSMIPAHVTAKGPVCDIPSIPELQAVISEQVRSMAPFMVKFSGERWALTSANGENLGSLNIEVTLELAKLHLRLLESVNPISTFAYPLDSRGVFRPHRTVFHEPEPELEVRAAEAMQELEIGDGFSAESVSLMGHIGTPYRGEWVLISEHRLGA